MFTSGGGGGFDFPMNGGPIEIVIVVLLLVGLAWLAFEHFGY
jgi:hypothetical protein